jgi:diaminopimelate epimerase
MKLNFEKWHGCRNDFIVVWLLPTANLVFDSLVRQAPALCVRDGSGIGADGIIVLHQNSPQDFFPAKLSVINSDGSLSNTCGNGIRCGALSILKKSLETGKTFQIPEGHDFELANKQIVNCRFMTRGKQPSLSNLPFVAVAMGETQINESCELWKDAQAEVARVSKELSLPQLQNDFYLVEIGNRHLVFFLEGADRDMLWRVGSAFQKSRFWDGINVHLVAASAADEREKSSAANLLGSAMEELFKALTWERGAGATQACGSGACAIGASALESGLVPRDKWIGVDMPGGRLFVKQEAPDDSVTLAGPGVLVFEGTLDF